MPATDDNPEHVVFQQMLKPYRTAVVTAIPLVVAIGTYGYDVVSFMNRDEVHEMKQDQNLLTLLKRITAQDATLKAIQERNLDTLRLMLSDLDMLRAKQIKTLPKRDRDQARRDFSVQRDKAIALLFAAQKDP